MSNISSIDKNFEVNVSFDTSDLKIYNVLEAPFRVYGLISPKDENDVFRRIPKELAENTNEGVLGLHTNTAGGRVRFKTNSKKVAIIAKMNSIGKMPHFAFTGSIGFDMFCDDVYKGTFIPPCEIEDGFSSLLELENDDFKEITINFPLYSGVTSLMVCLSKDAEVMECKEYKYENPVVYYGSSITQGGCASRPGMAYESIISRQLDCDHINLGFSGSARGEQIMADYIADLKMEAFVLDYDHNAPTPEHLKATHKKFYETIRQKNPKLPIIMATRPKYFLNEDEEKRHAIVKATYEEAVKNGDENAYFVSGKDIAEKYAADGIAVDGCHPTDLGFMCMADHIGKAVKKAIEGK